MTIHFTWLQVIVAALIFGFISGFVRAACNDFFRSRRDRT